MASRKSEEAKQGRYEDDALAGKKCAKNRKPWHKRDSENVESYAKFCEYRKLGAFKRSVAALVKAGLSRRTLSDLSAEHDWVARAQAWDLHICEIEIKQAEHQARVLTTRMLVDRQRVQDGFRRKVVDEKVGAVEKLHGIATSKDTRDSSKLKAWEMILKGAGYTAPVGISIDSIDDETIRAILERELAALVDSLPDAKAALFSELITEAFNARVIADQ